MIIKNITKLFISKNLNDLTNNITNTIANDYKIIKVYSELGSFIRWVSHFSKYSKTMDFKVRIIFITLNLIVCIMMAGSCCCCCFSCTTKPNSLRKFLLLVASISVLFSSTHLLMISFEISDQIPDIFKQKVTIMALYGVGSLIHTLLGFKVYLLYRHQCSILYMLGALCAIISGIMLGLQFITITIDYSEIKVIFICFKILF